jgi:prevent-host-death family protein
MPTVTMREAKAKLPELARRVEQGESITITRNGQPVLELVAPRKRGGINLAGVEEMKRRPGVDKLVNWVSPDFDDPLPEDFLISSVKLPAVKESKPPGKKRPK